MRKRIQTKITDHCKQYRESRFL